VSDTFVSVVTPFHNTEKYLVECIESVLAQSYDNFEYVLIDNQSTDGSTGIAERYARKHDRIRLVHTDRLLPQVENYNFSLEQSSPSARYSKMVQADDWIYPNCLSEMVAVADEHPSAGIIGAYYLVEDQVVGSGIHPSRKLISGAEACRMHMLERVYLFGSPTSLLYRSDIVRSRRPFFALGRLHEDTEAAFEILANSDFGFAHQVLSFSRGNPDSIMGRVRDFRPFDLDRFIIAKRYAHVYLTPDEAEQCLNAATAEYYFGLAGHWIADGFQMRDASYWDYQKRGLATVGETIRTNLLVRYASELAARRALSPIELVKSLRERARR